MGKKKQDDAGAGSKSKTNAKDVKKDKVISVSAMLAGMDQKPDKQKKSSTTSSKPKQKSDQKPSSYIDGIDLPPSDEEEDVEFAHVGDEQSNVSKRTAQSKLDPKILDISATGKEIKKREKKEMLAAYAAEQTKREALKDDRDAFTVVIGSKASVLEGEDAADANVKDITVDNFSVSARGKELLKNASVKIYSAAPSAY